MSSVSCVRKALCCVNLMFWKALSLLHHLRWTLEEGFNDAAILAFRFKVLGCGFLGIGIWMHLAYQGYSTLFSHQVLSGDSLIIVTGILTFLLGFLGCCGSWFRSKLLLRMYFVLVIVILLMEFTAGTLGFIYRKHVGGVLQDELLHGVQRRYTLDNRNGLKDTWDYMQLQFGCCGVKSYRDWFHISAWPDKEWVPSSCCRPKFANMSSCGQMEDIAFIYQSGCYPILHNWIMEKLYIVGIISLVFAFIQLFGIISALIIVCAIGNKPK